MCFDLSLSVPLLAAMMLLLLSPSRTSGGDACPGTASSLRRCMASLAAAAAAYVSESQLEVARMAWRLDLHDTAVPLLVNT